MDSLTLNGSNFCTTKAGLSAGTTTTLTTANTSLGSINGKAFSKAAAANAATPTTDFGTGLAFLPISPNQGSVFIIAYDAAGNLRVLQYQVTALDVGGNFIYQPLFPALPDTVYPVGYIVVKAGATAVGTWTFGTNNLSGVTGLTYTFVDVMMLPARPQAL